jgi:hypothetical protein
MRRVVWILVAAGLLAGFASMPVRAESPGVPSPGSPVTVQPITHDFSVRARGESLDGGIIASSFIPCLGRRKVQLWGRFRNGELTLLDTDVTSIGGAWATQANYMGGFVRIRAKVRQRHYRTPNGHRRLCNRGAVSWTP